MNKVLLVDDDVELAAMLQEYIGSEGFPVEVRHDGEAGVAAALSGQYAIVVLDVMMPRLNGIEALRRIRAHSQVPVLMLTARGDDVDRIVGLEMGADDYLPKPFNPRELVARIHAVLRRQPQTPPGAPASDDEDVHFGNIVVQLGTRILIRNGEETLLTTGEFALLKVLLQHPRQPLSRDRLMELARGREYDVFDRSIDVQISRLRKLIEEDPSKPRYLQTVWGFGYVFVPDGNKHSQ